MDEETPVPYATVSNLLMAAHQLLLDHHVEMATALLVKAEELIPRVADPQGYASLMNQADRLWKSKHIKTGMRPKGMRSGIWEQIELPLDTGEN